MPANAATTADSCKQSRLSDAPKRRKRRRSSDPRADSPPGHAEFDQCRGHTRVGLLLQGHLWVRTRSTEIGEMPTVLQAKLLQVLQDGSFSRLGGRASVKVDVRVIA